MKLFSIIAAVAVALPVIFEQNDLGQFVVTVEGREPVIFGSSPEEIVALENFLLEAKAEIIEDVPVAAPVLAPKVLDSLKPVSHGMNPVIPSSDASADFGLPPVAIEVAPVVEIAVPVVEIAAPVVEIAVPVVEIAAPVVEIAAPVVLPAAPAVQIAAPAEIVSIPQNIKDMATGNVAAPVEIVAPVMLPAAPAVIAPVVTATVENDKIISEYLKSFYGLSQNMKAPSEKPVVIMAPEPALEIPAPIVSAPAPVVEIPSPIVAAPAPIAQTRPIISQMPMENPSKVAHENYVPPEILLGLRSHWKTNDHLIHKVGDEANHNPAQIVRARPVFHK